MRADATAGGGGRKTKIFASMPASRGGAEKVTVLPKHVTLSPLFPLCPALTPLVASSLRLLLPAYPLSLYLSPSPVFALTLRVHVGTSSVAWGPSTLLSLGKNNTTCGQQLGLPVALSVYERLRLERPREPQQNKSGGGSGLRLAR